MEFVMKDVWIALADMKIIVECLRSFSSLSNNSILRVEVQKLFSVL